MKKVVLTLALLVMCAITWAQNNNQSAHVRSDNGKHLERVEKRDARHAEFVKFVDSLVLTRNFSFTPRFFQREPAGSPRMIYNTSFILGIYPNFTDIHLPISKGITPPYYTSILNYTISSVEGYTVIQDKEGWNISFSTSLFSSNDYTFTLKIYSSTREAVLSISSDLYGTTTYYGTITAHY